MIGMSDRDLLDEQAEDIERLQAALKPLANVKLWSDDRPDCSNDFVADYNLHLCFTAEQVKAARWAIADEQGVQDANQGT